MNIDDGNWKTFLARTAVLSTMLGIVVFGAVKLAVADPGGPTSPQLTFAGILRDASGALPTTARMATLTFTFTKPDAAPCSVEVRDVPIAVGGAFTAGVSIASCPTYFDGSNVTYTVSEGRDVLTPDGGVAITPVPYARFADQVGVSNDCPAGYARDATEANYVVCRRPVGRSEVDEVVKVGLGATSFWIDRYEATIWTASGDLLLNVRTEADLGALGLPRNGGWSGRLPQLFARSYAARDLPSRWVTWFQAEELCRASGKRLPTGQEWLTASRGTGGSSGESGCYIGSGTEPREVAGGAACVSAWGARDMVGNVWEWTADWYAGLVPNGGNLGSNAWPPDYGGDRTWNIVGSVQNTTGSMSSFAIPAAALRGGSWGLDSQAGRFALLLAYGPSYRDNNVGFRCVVPR